MGYWMIRVPGEKDRAFPTSRDAIKVALFEIPDKRPITIYGPSGLPVVILGSPNAWHTFPYPGV